MSQNYLHVEKKCATSVFPFYRVIVDCMQNFSPLGWISKVAPDLTFLYSKLRRKSQKSKNVNILIFIVEILIFSSINQFSSLKENFWYPYCHTFWMIWLLPMSPKMAKMAKIGQKWHIRPWSSLRQNMAIWVSKVLFQSGELIYGRKFHNLSYEIKNIAVFGILIFLPSKFTI